MPVRRIIEVAGIDPHTFYNRLDFLHRQCQLFAAHRERALANLPIRRLYLGVDRQDYLVNWLGRKDNATPGYQPLPLWTTNMATALEHAQLRPSLDRKTIRPKLRRAATSANLIRIAALPASGSTPITWKPAQSP